MGRLLQLRISIARFGLFVASLLLFLLGLFSLLDRSDEFQVQLFDSGNIENLPRYPCLSPLYFPEKFPTLFSACP